jgi:hypothetical protein
MQFCKIPSFANFETNTFLIERFRKFTVYLDYKPTKIFVNDFDLIINSLLIKRRSMIIRIPGISGKHKYVIDLLKDFHSGN